ncbi:MAG: hypothetical protein EZS28_012413 [Streblomastix strix]|uniref:Uncharacterized protein n=1 Tax=Streblomastix strix TaxID=222440 RepID=A0A5J4WBL5_9EUKA|nr:MAG: hypothetical protein EZS28_012413 [Streblomastix strix]
MYVYKEQNVLWASPFKIPAWQYQLYYLVLLLITHENGHEIETHEIAMILNPNANLKAEVSAMTKFLLFKIAQ